MNDVWRTIGEWLEAGQSVGLATVVKTWGSAPREVGAKMAFTATSQVVGSVSGGCVEAAVLDKGLRLLRGDAEPELLRFGVSNEQAWEVGLSCGGEIEVFIERLGP